MNEVLVYVDVDVLLDREAVEIAPERKGVLETVPPGDSVTFNDVGSGVVIVSNTVSPFSLLVSNNTIGVCAATVNSRAVCANA